MKTSSIGLVCVLTIFLCAPWSSMAQDIPSCDANSTVGNNLALLSELLQLSPYPECTNQLVRIATVQNFVADAEIVFTALAVICETNCTNFAYNFALMCKPLYVNLLGLACASNEDNRICYQTVRANNGTSVLQQCFPDQFQPTVVGTQATTTEEQLADNTTTMAENTTATTMAENTTDATTTMAATTTNSPGPSFVCRNECRAELETFRAFHGCCVSNAFNTTVFQLQVFGIANYSLWAACGVEPVLGYCPFPFALPTTVGATDAGFIATGQAMVVLLMVALIALIAH